MSAEEIAQRLAELHDAAYFARQPSELTGAIGNARNIARRVAMRAHCAHERITTDITTHGRRERVTTCATCDQTLTREEV